MASMESTLERELKLDPPVGFELPPLEGEDLESRVFTSTYYDTPPRSLLRAGITLRRRVESGLSRWQLKLPRNGLARAELETIGGPAGPPAQLAKLLRPPRRRRARSCAPRPCARGRASRWRRCGPGAAVSGSATARARSRT